MPSSTSSTTTSAETPVESTLGTKDSQVSLRLPGELKDRIERYAQMTGRSKSYVAMEALAEYLDWRLPQMQDLEQAIAAADRGEFATETEVAVMFKRYGVEASASAAAAAPKRRAAAPLAAPPATTRAAKPKRA